MPEVTTTTAQKKEVAIPSAIVIKDLAALLQLPLNRIIAELMKNGVMSSMNERIDYDTAAIIAEDLGFAPHLKEEGEAEQLKTIGEELAQHLRADDPNRVSTRPPVVVVMGHVDHGKTKLLDSIRQTDVMAGESGGITQHIGAYQVHKRDRLITFIDTPGHEAFTAMRSRGAQVADVAILVVAADDGIKPQTLEAIKIIKQAKIPFLVAINKIDKPEANIDRVKKQLAEQNLLTEDWGGTMVVVPVSAQTGAGIDELLDTVLLLADLHPEKLKADAERGAVGSVIDAHIDKGEGPVATVLVHTGTLHCGDYVRISDVAGRVKALKDWHGKEIDAAAPSTPAKMLGLKIAPQVGDVLVAVNAEEAKRLRREHKVTTERATSQVQYQKKSDAPKPAAAPTEKQVLNILLRSDNLGSQEAILESLLRLDSPYIGVEIVAKGLGNITDADVLRADTAKSLLVGFHVVPTARAQEVAKSKQVRIRTYTVIYDLLNDIKKEMEELLPVEIIETVLGHLRVLGVFRKEKRGMIVGGRITDGFVRKGVRVRVQRNGETIATGSVDQLQQEKKAVTEAKSGECGIRFEGEPAIALDDVLEFSMIEEQKRALTIA